MNKLIYLLKYLNYYLKQKNTYHISFFKCLKSFFCGFTPDEYYLFNFDKNDMKDYLSEFKRLYYRKKLNGEDYTSLLDNKVLFKLVTSNFLSISPFVYWKNNNYYFDENNNMVKLNEIIKRLNGIYFVKPLNAGGGKEIAKIICKKNEYFINERKVTLDDIRKELESRKSFILEKFVKQAKYLNEIYSKSANTIRIITLKNEKGNIVLTKALHRFGTEKSKPTDNFSRYGLACNIDIKTGELQKCLSKNSNIFFDNHPDTNKKIKGIKIPNWDAIKKNIIEKHYKLYFLDFIAWDILITDEGYVVIEANASCGSDILQLEKGLKENKDIYEVYKRIGAFK